MVLKSKLRIILSKIYLGYEILEISITTDAQHSTCPSCNLLQRIVGILSYPYKTAKSPILAEFNHYILNWKQFKPKRYLIEDVFKVIKGTFSLGKIHRFTLASVTKIASFGVVLAAISISSGFGDKESLQRLAEW